MKKMMFIEDESKFSFEETVSSVKKSLEANNWVISHTSNRQEYYKKHGLGIDKMITIDICKPDASYQIMKEDKNKRMAPMAPMRVAIYKKSDRKVYISRMKLKMMKNMTGGVIKRMMKESANDLEKALEPILTK